MPSWTFAGYNSRAKFTLSEGVFDLADARCRADRFTVQVLPADAPRNRPYAYGRTVYHGPRFSRAWATLERYVGTVTVPMALWQFIPPTGLVLSERGYELAGDLDDAPSFLLPRCALQMPAVAPTS